MDTAPDRVERGRQVLRGVELWSERLGLTGRADVVEVLADGTVGPVEYKQGVRHSRNAEIQLCAQGLCLEEMLQVDIAIGHVWYGGIRRRDRVRLDRELRDLTERTIASVRSLFLTSRLPDAVNDRRCDECQLLGHCLPTVVANQDDVAAYIREEVLACG